MRYYIAILLLIFVTPAMAATVPAIWDAPTTREDGTALPSDELGGYIIFYGTAPGDYSESIDVGSVNEAVIDCNASAGQTFFFNIKPYDVDGLQGGSTEEQSYTFPLSAPSPPSPVPTFIVGQ